MKKIIVSICAILLAFSLMSCKQNSTTDDVIIEIGESTKFTNEEVIKAADYVHQNFRISGMYFDKGMVL